MIGGEKLPINVMLWLADWPTTDCCFVMIGGHGVSQYLAAAAKNRYSRPPNEVHRPKHLSFVSWQFFFLSMEVQNQEGQPWTNSLHINYCHTSYRVQTNKIQQWSQLPGFPAVAREPSLALPTFSQSSSDNISFSLSVWRQPVHSRSHNNKKSHQQ